MRGPFWNDKTGVTGEPKWRTVPPNYVTVIDSEGKTYTLTGEAANEYRNAHPGFGGAPAGSMPPGM